MTDMVSLGKYSIVNHLNENKLVICLPATKKTVRSTRDRYSNRRDDISTEDAMLLLTLVEYLFERSGENENYSK